MSRKQFSIRNRADIRIQIAHGSVGNPGTYPPAGVTKNKVLDAGEWLIPSTSGYKVFNMVAFAYDGAACAGNQNDNCLPVTLIIDVEHKKVRKWDHKGPFDEECEHY